MKSEKNIIIIFLSIFLFLIFLPGCQAKRRLDSRNYQAEAGEYLKKKEIDKALSKFDDAIKADPLDYLAYYNRGWTTLMYKYDIDKASADIKKSLELNPAHVNSYLLKGDICKFKKQFNEAIKTYNRAAELEPENPLPYRGKSGVYLHIKKYKLALKQINKAIKIEPTSQDYLDRGWIYFKKKEYKLALKDYNKAFGMENVDMVKYYTLRGLIPFDRKEYDKALNYFQKSRKIRKKQNDSTYYLGIIYQDRKEYKKALSLFREYLDEEYLNENYQWVMYFYEEEFKDTKRRIKELEKILDKNKKQKNNAATVTLITA